MKCFLNIVLNVALFSIVQMLHVIFVVYCHEINPISNRIYFFLSLFQLICLNVLFSSGDVNHIHLYNLFLQNNKCILYFP